ncbi:frizzled-8 [Hydra vulgaris]|uniref:Frizzled-8 n=1 Tax=Hydra vulgaris TaxID=6087 RepID=A0ABM4BDF8_HYDVU
MKLCFKKYWITFLVFNSVTTSDLIGMFNYKQKCEKITSDICVKNINSVRYNSTKFPNLLNHRSQHEANVELAQFSPLVKVGCSPHLAQFLCAVYIPLCMEKYDKLIPPCQELCMKSKGGCSSLMERYGFIWPSVLDCDNFPKQDNNSTLCIGVSEKIVKPSPGTNDLKGEWHSAKENEVVNLKCSKEKVIEIRKIRHSKSSSCCTKASQSVISAICDGKKNCKLTVTSSILGGHCNGAVGDLSIRYKCVSQSKVKACNKDDKS